MVRKVLYVEFLPGRSEGKKSLKKLSLEDNIKMGMEDRFI
jgi:hypothetical protein